MTTHVQNIALLPWSYRILTSPRKPEIPFSGIFFFFFIYPFAFEAGLSLKFWAFFGLEPRFVRYLSMSVAHEPSIYQVIW